MRQRLTPGESPPMQIDSIYEQPYALVKEAVFEVYLWGLRTDNDDAIDFYKQILDDLRAWDDKFVRAGYLASTQGNEPPTAAGNRVNREEESSV